MCVFWLKCFCFENSNFRIMDPVEIVAFGRFLFHNALWFWKMTRIENESYTDTTKIQNESRKKNPKEPNARTGRKMPFPISSVLIYVLVVDPSASPFLGCAPTLLAYATPLKGMANNAFILGDFVRVCAEHSCFAIVLCVLSTYAVRRILKWNAVGWRKKKGKETRGRMRISKTHKHRNMART